MNLEGTETARSLMKAFAGESQARNRYMIYAEKAHQEGLHQIAQIFTITASNEDAHAKQFFQAMNEYGLNQRTVDIAADFPVAINNTMTNLESAAQGEHEEHAKLYPEYAQIAGQEGFPGIAKLFSDIASIEKNHEERFRAFYELVRDNELLKKDVEITWICDVCGYVYTGTEPPKICPVCKNPQGYYQVYRKDY